MTPVVATIMLQVASDMLQHVRRQPFYLGSNSRGKTDRGDSTWCTQFENEVRTNEEAYWSGKVTEYEKKLVDAKRGN